jgi:hypothetical protein
MSLQGGVTIEALKLIPKDPEVEQNVRAGSDKEIAKAEDIYQLWWEAGGARV